MARILLKEDIKFIDTYLSNSDIHYEDVRIEMMDHVASAIEEQMNNGDHRGFYNIFKDYMVVHKKELLKQGKGFKWKIFKSVLKLLFSKALSPLTILSTFVLFLISISIHHYVHTFGGFELYVYGLSMILILALIIFLRLGKKKYLFTTHLLSILCFFGYLPNFVIREDYFSDSFIIIFLIIYSFIFCAGISALDQLIKHYKNELQLA